jgi:hypothetical protein
MKQTIALLLAFSANLGCAQVKTNRTHHDVKSGSRVARFPAPHCFISLPERHRLPNKKYPTTQPGESSSHHYLDTVSGKNVSEVENVLDADLRAG